MPRLFHLFFTLIFLIKKFFVTNKKKRGATLCSDKPEAYGCGTKGYLGGGVSGSRMDCIKFNFNMGYSLGNTRFVVGGGTHGKGPSDWVSNGVGRSFGVEAT